MNNFSQEPVSLRSRILSKTARALVWSYVAYLATDYLSSFYEQTSFRAFFGSLFYVGGPSHHILGTLAFALVFFGCLLTSGFVPSNLPSVLHERGRKLISYEKAMERAERLRPRGQGQKEKPWKRLRCWLGQKKHNSRTEVDAKEAAKEPAKEPAEDSGIFWGMLNLPSDTGTGHFAVSGIPGSGKTITLRLLMQSVVPKVGTGRGLRAVVFDYKREMYSLLDAMIPRIKQPNSVTGRLEEGPQAQIKTLNPLDKRCFAWDMATDITTPAVAEEIASILIPEDKAAQPYFTDSARQILAAVFISFAERKRCTKKGWKLRDVVLAMAEPERIRAVLRHSDAAALRVTRLLEGDNAPKDVLSTIATKMNPYSTVAALWEGRPMLSLCDWRKEESILLLTYDKLNHAALDPINRAIIERLCSVLLDEDEVEGNGQNQSWVFLDEFRALGRLTGIPNLLNLGRSKGVCVALGFQDIDGVKEVYGQHGAAEITGQCNNKTFLRASAGTAAWAQDHFGTRQVAEEDRKEGNRQRQTRPVVMASELQAILETNEDNGIIGYHDISKIGSYKTHFAFNEILHRLKKPDKEKHAKNFEPREDQEQTLVDWGKEERNDLGLDTGVIQKRHQPLQKQTQDELWKVTRRKISD